MIDGTDKKPRLSVSELYDVASTVLTKNPYDGRTREGRAWSDAAWKVFTDAAELADRKVSGEEVPS